MEFCQGIIEWTGVERNLPLISRISRFDPTGLADEPYLDWYLQLMPRLTKAAGFELGSRIYINPVPPEGSAEAMRAPLRTCFAFRCRSPDSERGGMSPARPRD